jgi:NADH-quinone oxidoreductase subunit J
MIMDVFFLFFAGLAIFFGFNVVSSRNPMHSAISLVVTLMAIAGLFLLLHAEFLAWILIILYTGAVMVLIIFVISLMNLENDRPISWSISKKWGVGFLLFFLILFAIYLYQDPLVSFSYPERLPVPDAWGSAESLAIELFTRYVLPFELASVLLTAAVIGAVLLARSDVDEGEKKDQ